jgi:hypothetical protein
MSRLVYFQYTLLTLLFIVAIYIGLALTARRRDPWNVLAVFTGLNILRFGAGLAAIAALGRANASFIPAVGDCLTALLAVTALMMLLRRAPHALLLAGITHAVGLLDILLAEGLIGYLELKGRLVRRSYVHVPSVGAALYSALHLYSFYFIARASSAQSPART